MLLAVLAFFLQERQAAGTGVCMEEETMSKVEDCCSSRYLIQQLPRKERVVTKQPQRALLKEGPRGAARRSAKFKVTTAKRCDGVPCFAHSADDGQQPG